MADWLPYVGVITAVLNSVYMIGVMAQRMSHLEKRVDAKELKDEKRDVTLNEIQVTLARVDGRLAAIATVRDPARKAWPF